MKYFFKKGELKLLWNFYIYLIFWTFSLMIHPYTYIYFRDLGFSFSQTASLTAAMMLSLFIFEVPTGILADRKGRKVSVMTGLLIVGSAPFLIAFTDNYYIVLSAYILIGLGMTFISGAEEALVVDNLKFHGREDLIPEYYTKFSSFMGLGTVAAYALGSLIVRYAGIKPLWYIWGAGYLLSAVLLLFIKEHREPREEKRSSFLEPVKLSLSFIKKNRGFLNYVLGSAFMTIVAVQKDLWNLLLRDNGLEISTISLLASLTSFVVIFLPWLSKKFRDKPLNRVLTVTALIRVVILVLALFVENIRLLAALFILLGSLYSFESPLTSSWVQNRLDSGFRATMGSFLSMFYSLAGAGAGIFMGFMADFAGTASTIAFFALFALAGALFYSRISFRINKGGENEMA